MKMKNLIAFYYNLNVEDLVNVEDGIFSFYVNYVKYYFFKPIRPVDDIEEIFKIVNSTPNSYHQIIINKMGNILTEYEKDKYILLKIIGSENSLIDINDVINDIIPVKDNKHLLNRYNWSSLWENKIDYLEYQVSELSTNYKIITRSFSYYVGLAENAIMYFNMLNPKGENVVLARRRINYPTIRLNYLNPLNIIVDYKVRDIAEYLKVNFFNGEDTISEVDQLISKNVLSPLDYNLLFCRLIYPSYYFDDMQKVLEKSESENILIKYIERIDEYEDFLNKVFFKFSKKCSMIKIDWLIKNI